MFPDHLVLAPVGGRHAIERALFDLRPGVTEVFVHPAVDSDELRASHPDWPGRVEDHAFVCHDPSLARPHRPRRRDPHRLPRAARPPAPAVSLRRVGVDVARRARGCDVVASDDDLVARPVGRVHTAAELARAARRAPARRRWPSTRRRAWASDRGRPTRASGSCTARRLARSPHPTPRAATGTPSTTGCASASRCSTRARAVRRRSRRSPRDAIASVGRRPERGLLRDPRRSERGVSPHSTPSGVDTRRAAEHRRDRRGAVRVHGAVLDLAGEAVERSATRDEGQITLPRGALRAATVRSSTR